MLWRTGMLLPPYLSIFAINLSAVSHPLCKPSSWYIHIHSFIHSFWICSWDNLGSIVIKSTMSPPCWLYGPSVPRVAYQVLSFSSSTLINICSLLNFYYQRNRTYSQNPWTMVGVWHGLILDITVSPGEKESTTFTTSEGWGEEF